ncbi:MAG: TrkA family potassium uptake protein [Deltaproteobacteria bacterium]|nr:TrkA family potassium uptake protein [Deltaproteobacteria bacterium]
MKVAVIRLGLFGSYVAKALYEKGHDVLVIDREKGIAQKAQLFSSKSVIADGTDRDVLEGLGIADMDLIIVAIGNNLSGSILATMYLTELGVKNIIVKADNDDHKKILEKLGATQVIIPEREMAQKLARSITHPNVLDYLPLTEEYAVMEIIPPKSFVGKTLIDLQLRQKYGIQVIAIKDAVTDAIALVIPPEREIGSTDQLILIGKQEAVEKIKGLGD